MRGGGGLSLPKPPPSGFTPAPTPGMLELEKSLPSTLKVVLACEGEGMLKLLSVYRGYSE